MKTVAYFYSTALGKARLHVTNKPLKNLGDYKTESEARSACNLHYIKACRMARNAGRPAPQQFFI